MTFNVQTIGSAELQEAFDILNFSAEEKFNTYKMCSALVHMGELKFKERQEQAELDGEDGEISYEFIEDAHAALLQRRRRRRRCLASTWRSSSTPCASRV